MSQNPKELIPSYSAAMTPLGDDEVLEIRWCRACNRGRAQTADTVCPSCSGNRVVTRVRSET